MVMSAKHNPIERVRDHVSCPHSQCGVRKGRAWRGGDAGAAHMPAGRRLAGGKCGADLKAMADARAVHVGIGLRPLVVGDTDIAFVRHPAPASVAGAGCDWQEMWDMASGRQWRIADPRIGRATSSGSLPPWAGGAMLRRVDAYPRGREDAPISRRENCRRRLLVSRPSLDRDVSLVALHRLGAVVEVHRSGGSPAAKRIAARLSRTFGRASPKEGMKYSAV